MIHICVPVLKRYDLLHEMFLSLAKSTVRPQMIHIIDNGRDPERMARVLEVAPCSTDVYRPDDPMGLAESWNWFIDNVPEDRVITNDDITFAPDSLAMMAAQKAAFVSCTFGFSCFIIRDACVAQVGKFDETISPGYAYFEDMDYLHRMRELQVTDDVVECGVVHKQSSTPEKFTKAEWEAHHKKFRRAMANYQLKWNEEPQWDDLKDIGGNGAHA